MEREVLFENGGLFAPKKPVSRVYHAFGGGKKNYNK
jgi:hypothetical protein